MTMIKKLDKKTKILLLLIVTAAIGFMILSIFLNYPLNSSLALLVGSFMLCAMVIQINLDKRFTSQQLARIQNRVNNDFLEINKGINSLTVQISAIGLRGESLSAHILDVSEPTAPLAHRLDAYEQYALEFKRKLSYELHYANKQFSDDLRLLESNHSRDLAVLRRAHEGLASKISSLAEKIGTDHVGGSDATVKARKQPFRLQTSLVSAKKPTAHGRGAALVAKDPNRAESISSRILVPNDNILFSIGSQKMNMILGEQSNYPIVSVFPNSIVSEFQKLFESLDANATVVLVIEAKALSDGAWASSLSAAGSRLFTVLDSVIKELRDRGGFTFLVGEFKAKNTFTNSLADNVDSHITDENFKEDWALDASLSLPRALRSYALEGGNANE